MRDHHCQASGAISRHGTTGVKPEPPHPEHGCPHHSENQTVRRHAAAWKTSPFPQKYAQHKSGNPRIHMDDDAAGEISHTHFAEKSPAPYPMSYRGIDNGHPQRHEEQHRREFHTLGKCPDDESRRDDGECQLEHLKHGFWNTTDEAIDANV